MEKYKNQLIGQREGMQYVLDLLKITEKNIENGIKLVNEKLEEVYENGTTRGNK